jgi:hypothetical protein
LRDSRRSVLESALFSPDLTPAEKVLMVVVVTIKPEYVDGELRHGSRAMGPNGKFSLHLDYLAAATSTSTEAVRKIQRSLARKHHLSLVHEARFGRPTTWQGLVVRGAKNGSLTGGEIGTPYGLGDWLVRGAESAPLTYKTPDRRNHETAPRVLPATERQAVGTEEGSEDHLVRSDLTPCEWHGWSTCPPDCANHPTAWRSA